MLGLFGTLNLGARSLQAQQTAVQVTSQNLANVNNPAYARQRVQLQTSPTVAGPNGPQGTGVLALSIQQLRDRLVDGQVASESSVGGYWTAQQSSLQKAQVALGEFIDRNADATTAAGSGAATGLADALAKFFNRFQSVAREPGSREARASALAAAQDFALRLNQTSGRLAALNAGLNQEFSASVAQANQLLAQVASLNESIRSAELGGVGQANELRDLRQQKLEALAGLMNFSTTENANGTVDIAVEGQPLVAGVQVADSLAAYDAGGGQWQLRTASAGSPVALTGGSLAGVLEVRDGSLQLLRDRLDGIAGALIASVNGLHRAGYSLTGSSGEVFFSGADAASIAVNGRLVEAPELLQAARAADEPGDGSVARALAQLAEQAQAGLGGNTLAGAYGAAVAGLGEGLSTANDQLAQHEAVAAMLQRQRDSVSGVSVDEEMADLVRFQRAYEASARIISTVDEMIQTVLGMKR